MRGTKVKKIPRRIKKLVHLETLDLKRTQVTVLPDEVYKLRKLRILLVSNSSSDDQGVDFSADVSCLSAIQKLSLMKVENHGSIQALSRLSELRKLGLVTNDARELLTVLQRMEHLSTLDVRSSGGVHLNLDCCTFPKDLERLHLSGGLLNGSLLKHISDLHSLQKISLYRSHLTVNPLVHLGAVTNLIELHLWAYYNGEELKFEAKKFEANKFKKLETLIIGEFTNLNSLVFENEAAPELKKLTISKCNALRKTGVHRPKNFTAATSLNGELLPENFTAATSLNVELLSENFTAATSLNAELLPMDQRIPKKQKLL